MSSRARGGLRLVALITALVAVMVVTLFLTALSADDHGYDAAAEAAARGDWPEALRRLSVLAERNPHFRDVDQRLREAAWETAAEMADLDPRLEVELIGDLASVDAGALADALDECVASIPAGAFRMGSEDGRADEVPERSVRLSGFSIDRFEVTNAQYQRYLRATGVSVPAYWTGIDYPPGQADRPVVGIGWSEANDYCAWAGKRLPTEAEWERACRGADDRTYPWGDEWNADLLNVVSLQLPLDDPVGRDPAWPLLLENQATGEPGLRPVGSYPDGASPDRVFDLQGNAAEWVVDWYDAAGYGGLPDQDPIGLAPPWSHVVRGVGWLDRFGRPGEVAVDARCAARNASHATEDLRIGFRCAASP